MINESSYILIGRISGPHGLDGRLKISVVTDKEERFSPGSRVYILRNGMYTEYCVESFEWHKGRIALCSFEGVNDRNGSEALACAEIFITQEEAEKSRGLLGEREFYYYDLIGSDVYKDGKAFGKVDAIVEGGAGCILSIKNGDGKEFLVPFVDEMVSTTRLMTEKIIDITPVDGLLDEDK
ncbi:MAG: ribosome maturation factor RimM [Spirochaetota bacterium]